jgi:signal transduction histidine kinase
MGNEVLLARMVANLVGNAVHHNVAGGSVHISSGSDGMWSRLVVDNTGPVLGPERVAQLGEPFYRPGAERLYNRDGSGLGLSIAKAVAAAHGGTLALHGRSGGGLQVVVELPAGPPR